MNITGNLNSVRERIARAGRSPDDITIVAVTKGFDAEVCRQSVAAGLTNLGENRVAEALSKVGVVEGATWHLIGHLQTNKVKISIGKFALIQTLDSLHLAEAIARQDGTQKVLVEVNVAREPQRTGAAPEKAVQLAAEVAGLVEVLGFMAMGPAEGDPAPAFEEVRQLRDEAQERLGKPLPILSMGMSGDYEAAVRAGSTMLRLGTALFGPRP